MSYKIVYHEQRKVIDFTSEREAYSYYVKIAENYEVLNYNQYTNDNNNARRYTLDITFRTRERDLLK